MLNPIIEIIVYCADMQAQVEFYRDVLGLTVSFPNALDSYADEYWVTFDTGACTLALHGGGTQQQGPDAAKFVFGTDDLRAAHEMLVDHAVKVGPVREPASGVEVFDAWDPEGNVFSIESRR